MYVLTKDGLEELTTPSQFNGKEVQLFTRRKQQGRLIEIRP